MNPVTVCLVLTFVYIFLLFAWHVRAAAAVASFHTPSSPTATKKSISPSYVFDDDRSYGVVDDEEEEEEGEESKKNFDFECLPFEHNVLSSSDPRFTDASWLLFAHGIGPVDLSCSNPFVAASYNIFCNEYNTKKANETTAQVDRSSGALLRVARQLDYVYDLCMELSQVRDRRVLHCLGLSSFTPMQMALMPSSSQQNMFCAMLGTCGLDRFHDICFRGIVPLHSKLSMCMHKKQRAQMEKSCRSAWFPLQEVVSIVFASKSFQELYELSQTIGAMRGPRQQLQRQAAGGGANILRAMNSVIHNMVHETWDELSIAARGFVAMQQTGGGVPLNSTNFWVHDGEVGGMSDPPREAVDEGDDGGAEAFSALTPGGGGGDYYLQNRFQG